MSVWRVQWRTSGYTEHERHKDHDTEQAALAHAEQVTTSTGRPAIVYEIGDTP